MAEELEEFHQIVTEELKKFKEIAELDIPYELQIAIRKLRRKIVIHLLAVRDFSTYHEEPPILETLHMGTLVILRTKKGWEIRAIPNIVATYANKNFLERAEFVLEEVKRIVEQAIGWKIKAYA